MLSKILSIFFTLAILFSAAFLIRIENVRRQVKEDFVELSKAKYGIFNVDVWKEKISEIVANKIDEFQFDPDNKKELITKIESFLYDAVDLLEASYKSQRTSSIKGFLQNVFTSGVELFDRIRDNVPSFAENIVNDLEKPETRAQIKKYIKVQIDQYADETFSQMDYTAQKRILLKYDLKTSEEAKAHLTNSLNNYRDNTLVYKVIIYSSAIFLIIVLFLGKGELKKVELIIALVATSGLLFLGLFLPMIDIDARISRFDLVILDQHIDFESQILYYKSKSILEVVGLMLSQAKLDVAVVGFLVLTFSVLFPVAKIISAFSFLTGSNSIKAGFIHFFVFKSGKWSMADVLVVAIFMAYIGFSSILSEQLRQIENISDSLQVLTTNHSELNTGFFMFFGFVCLSLVISDRINKVAVK